MTIDTDPLRRFAPAVRDWFTSTYPDGPTPAQAQAWQAIGSGENTLVVAPTGSGKTLAAFLWALDDLVRAPEGDTAEPRADPSDAPRPRCRVLYVSPLKALAADVERNLREPLAGLRAAMLRRGERPAEVTVGMRTGDTPSHQRRTLGTRPPDILITTPESLFLVLTSRARSGLAGVETVIVDEVHAVAGTKRGAHLALSLERLDALLPRPAQRIGLSATVRPVTDVARFLSGYESPKPGGDQEHPDGAGDTDDGAATGDGHDAGPRPPGRARPTRVVAPPATPNLEVRVEVPVPDMVRLAPQEPGGAGDDTGASSPAAARQARASIWPHLERRVLDLIRRHHATIVFTNARMVAERLCGRVNELAAAEVADAGTAEGGVEPAPPAQVMGASGWAEGVAPVVARAHHGSVSKSERAVIESELKAGRLPAVVATSSLELGIDMGAVDLVVQVEAPPSVASGLQRVGRAGHHVGGVSRGVVLPKYRGDLLATLVVAERMRVGAIEELRVTRNPLDVLAQQVVAMVAMDDWTVAELAAVVRRAAPFAELPDAALRAVLDLLAGRYPSAEFAELRPRLVWDRASGRLSARPGAQRLAVTAGGTIPDRGTYAVHLVGGAGPSRVGELDEEMVYESRVGDVFVLGASSWRIEEITADRVLVSPAPGRAGRLPFWKADTPGRPVELGRALGARTRELAALPREEALGRVAEAGLDEWAAHNLVDYLCEQREAVGTVPDDRTVVVERFRDELGDWRFVVHSPFGARVNAPWALLLAERLRERRGLDAQVVHGDDGIILRLPDVADAGEAALEEVAALVAVPPEEVESAVTAALRGSALLAARFRECAARALLLPPRRPGQRMPLWQQRQRSAHLLSVAGRYGSFPILVEAVRECLHDVFDVAGLVELMADVAARRVRVVRVETRRASPFAQSLLLEYTARFLYEDDAPAAERRAQALALDTGLLAELLGRVDPGELLDARVVAEVAAELQRLPEERHPRGVEGAVDLLRELGPLSVEEARERGVDPDWLAALERARRVVRVRLAGRPPWWAVVEDAGRLRDAAGAELPDWLTGPGSEGVRVFTEPVAEPLRDLVVRYARTHGPFSAAEVAARFGVEPGAVVEVLHGLADEGGLVRGRFRPGLVAGDGGEAGGGGVDAAGGDGGGAGDRGGAMRWCDAEVARMLRRRSAARSRREVAPVPPRDLARFVPVWQHAAPGWRLDGPDAVFTAVETLRGASVPASVLESLVLPSRVSGYVPTRLDELTAAGEVVWTGAGRIGGADGWVCLVPADEAVLLPEPAEVTRTPVHDAVLAALSEGGGALFFRDVADRVMAVLGTGAVGDTELVAALWELTWAGWLSNDTLAPLRALLGSGGAAPRSTRRRRAVLPTRTGPATVAGRWWRLPERESDPTRRAHAAVAALLDRHGVVTRGAVVSEQGRGVAGSGGFAGMYPVLREFEEAGQARRGYFVDGLGAAQFALPGAVDRLRAAAGTEAPVVLAAADPANVYGVALPWPEPPEGAGVARPARRSGALVVLDAGELSLYAERGGRGLVTFTADAGRLRRAVGALVGAVREGVVDVLSVERVNGESAFESTLAPVLADAGFHSTPKALRLRR